MYKFTILYKNPLHSSTCYIYLKFIQSTIDSFQPPNLLLFRESIHSATILIIPTIINILNVYALDVTFSTNLQRYNKSPLLLNLLYLPKIYSIKNRLLPTSKPLSLQRIVVQPYSSFQQLYLTRLYSEYNVFYKFTEMQ